MSGVIRWEEPPPGRRGPAKGPRRTEHWHACAEQLRERPGDWAVLIEGGDYLTVGGMANQIVRGRLAAFRPDGAFEARTLSTSDGFAVYARYVGVRYVIEPPP